MRLLLLAASGLFPLVIVLAWGINHLVEERKAQAERSALELSRALSTAVDSELRSIEALLEQMGTIDELESADFRGFHLAARRNAEQLGWRQVVLSDGEGNVLLRTNDPFGTTRAEAVDPQSLAQVLREKRPVVTQIVLSPGSRENTFAVRVPVIRGGQVVYVLTAVLSPDVIGKVLTRQAIPTGSVASVFDQSGRRVARSTQTTSPFPTDSLKALLDQPGMQGVGRTVTREGVENYTGFTRLPDARWAIVVGNSVAEANRGLYALLRAVAVGLALSLALAIALAWLLSRRVLEPIDQLKGAAAALGRGDPVNLQPLDIEELDEVAVALRNAAAERDRAMGERNRSLEERERAAAEREQMASQIADALRMAEDANRSKDQFLAMLGHELRNPLAPISNAVQLMALKGDPGTAQERRIIERQLVHVTRLVDDLLDVSRITTGRLALRREPVRIAQILRQVADTIQHSLYQRALSLDLEDDVEDAWVEGDEVRLVQVFNNLLVNAIKFTPAGGKIRLGARIEGGEVRVDVEDNGIGMSPEDLARVFDLFYQAPQSADRARGGLGLGLPIVKSLVSMHRGTVQASSGGEGQGACITVRLPRCAAPAASQEVQAAAPGRGAGSILVVDDNEDAADTCATLLEMSGYVVRVAYTPEAALDALIEFTPDIAILDIGLPGMSGHDLARMMKGMGYSGRLVALTGYGQAADMAASKSAGFDAHLTKPVNPGELLDLVGKLAGSTADSSLRA
jgi:signal transduction histidine kinase/ActR/RegA family two-component response regulator